MKCTSNTHGDRKEDGTRVYKKSVGGNNDDSNNDDDDKDVQSVRFTFQDRKFTTLKFARENRDDEVKSLSLSLSNSFSLSLSFSFSLASS